LEQLVQPGETIAHPAIGFQVDSVHSMSDVAITSDFRRPASESKEVLNIFAAIENRAPFMRAKASVQSVLPFLRNVTGFR
jgi:hypothetical protein